MYTTPHYEEDGFLLASTKTGADGRYVLCRVPFLDGLTLEAFMDGFTDVGMFLGANGIQTLDLEMRRQ